MNGFRACGLVVSAVEAARKLALALAENRLHRELKNFTRPKLLILDQAQALLLFQIIAQRYDTGGAIVLTSNKPFADWAHVFAGGAIIAGATDPLLANPQPKDNRPAS